MKLHVIRPQEHWLAVHKAGCADLRRIHPMSEDRRYPWMEDHESLTEAAESIASDFIAEGSMTVEEALNEIHFFPCVTLPLEAS